jgi:hypothetical protein
MHIVEWPGGLRQVAIVRFVNFVARHAVLLDVGASTVVCGVVIVIRKGGGGIAGLWFPLRSNLSKK